MSRVTIENLYKTYNSAKEVDESQIITNAVLKGINLQIQEGEFMVLVGPSGCGKSTLLRLIAGLEEISGGKIYIGDRIVNELPPKARDIAMVFQNYALYPHLSVYDNIAFGLRRMKNNDYPSNSPIETLLSSLTGFLPPSLRYVNSTEKKIQAQVKTVAEMLQIDHLLFRLPKQLSGGQKQRVALGRAIARNPQVFLMDEPLSNLDAKLRTETRMQIVKLQKQLQVTTIYVTHDQTEAMTMGDRIAVMNQGEIQQIATPLEIYQHPANTFVAQFIGSPAMNLLEVNYQKPDLLIYGQTKIPLTSQWQEILKDYNYEKIWLGIRPELFYVTEESSASIPVIVNLVEALGHETILTVNAENNPEQNLQIKLFNHDLITFGEKINLGIQLENVNFFDHYTRQNILLKS
ncbi:ABC transporter ATP-binding protein [Cyanobacterium aponinum]|uniref:Carbohydrate ABC transporter ATP-binding protein, CUT1 family n=1 Tax=Cyanobacterium aponinum (strain PCC 10605) TaxID=755178 RepID=K9ZA95_CYAAP|nr:ABC transporter ATP-binding protein [Cyanobacterium aponinum]AFZ55288.1 carbohydrate ABC transporter ATP-binding protein, CUT1 family [Cyanobacterium aponinum PCC 10605]